MAYAMNATTANRAAPADQSPRAARAKPTFWTRLINAMIKSRMRSAELELRRHSRFLEEFEAGKITIRQGETFERDA